MIWVILLLLSNMLQGTQNDSLGSHSYYNREMGFRLELPGSWTGNVYTQEKDGRTVFMYKSVSGNEDAEVMSIFLITPIQFKIHDAHVGFYREISERNGLIVAAFLPTGVPYDNTLISQQKDYAHFFEVFASVNSVLATFLLQPGFDQSLYYRVLEEGALKDETYREEYERILKAEKAAQE